MYHFGASGQAMRRNNAFHQRRDFHTFKLSLVIRQLTVVIEKLLNQFLQVAAAVIEDADHLFLLQC